MIAHRGSLAPAILAIGALIGGPVAAQRIVTGAERVVTVASGASALMVYDAPVQRFSIGDPDVSDAVAVSPLEVLVTGKKLGTTSLLVWQAGGRVAMYSIQVTADAPALERYLGALFPEDGIAVSASANTVTLTGRVRSRGVAQYALDIAKGTGAAVIDRMQAPPGRQVLLQVRFAEVSRSAGKAMSTALSTLNPHRLDTPLDSIFGSTLSEGLVSLFVSNPNANFEALIRVLKSKGEFRSLAEPNLMALPGEEASFLAGGEFPYPVVQSGQSSGAVTIVFKEFGIRLRFTPEVTEAGNIRLHVAPEVSSLDFANGLNFQGYTIPSLLTRRAETEVELRDGQYLAIAGLLDNNWTKNQTKIPLLGDIPILGAFFRSSDAQQSRTELLVLVSPRLIDATDTAPALPTGEASTWQWDGSLRGPANPAAPNPPQN